MKVTPCSNFVVFGAHNLPECNIRAEFTDDEGDEMDEMF
jgi:hypothetical protein